MYEVNIYIYIYTLDPWAKGSRAVTSCAFLGLGVKCLRFRAKG